MYLNKVTREIDWPSFLKLFYIFGHETHLFDNHLHTYLKYTVFSRKNNSSFHKLKKQTQQNILN
jgi:hypothetical protein